MAFHRHWPVSAMVITVIPKFKGASSNPVVRLELLFEKGVSVYGLGAAFTLPIGRNNRCISVFVNDHVNETLLHPKRSFPTIF